MVRRSPARDNNRRGDFVQSERVVDRRPADDRDDRRQELHPLPRPGYAGQDECDDNVKERRERVTPDGHRLAALAFDDKEV